MSSLREPASFRDPSGFVFYREGVVLRQVNAVYGEEYRHLMDSGLYQELVQERLMVAHEDIGKGAAERPECLTIIKPDRVPFISYPGEWCFSQLKQAALLTLKLQARALHYGMTLKDCSGYNVQFQGVRPVFIDTLSFARVRPGEPWVAYRQFCQHFLAPLALMSIVDVRLGSLLRTHLDGVPLDFASRILPLRTRFNAGLGMHIHTHATWQTKPRNATSSRKTVSALSLKALADHLTQTVTSLRCDAPRSGWTAYYQDGASYSANDFSRKQEIVRSFLERSQAGTVLDVGANTGFFSRLAASVRGALVVSIDADPWCVELGFRKACEQEAHTVLPLVVDLTNPPSAQGWGGIERGAFHDRVSCDVGLALAVIHHLVIGNNLSFEVVASTLGSLCSTLIIEFVPKDDPLVRSMLGVRQDIFSSYTRENFEQAFGTCFFLEESTAVGNSGRIIYRMHKK